MGGQQERVWRPVFVTVAVIDGPDGRQVVAFDSEYFESRGIDLYAWKKTIEADHPGVEVYLGRTEATRSLPFNPRTTAPRRLEFGEI